MILDSEAEVGVKQKKWIIHPWISVRSPQPRGHVWNWITRNWPVIVVLACLTLTLTPRNKIKNSICAFQAERGNVKYVCKHTEELNLLRHTTKRPPAPHTHAKHKHSNKRKHSVSSLIFSFHSIIYSYCSHSSCFAGQQFASGRAFSGVCKRKGIKMMIIKVVT